MPVNGNILDSYLVELGATVDRNSWSKFNLTINDAEKTVGKFTGNTVLSFVKMDATVVGVLASIGTGLISLADKTAMADQRYRLFGMRMLMNKESARAMQLATKELGATLDEIAYDPELNRRFQYLYEQNIKLGRAMGQGFDDNMISIRDIRMEYKRFSTELDFMTGGVISKLFEKLGFGSGDVQAKLHKLNDWISDNLPNWSNEIANDLIPAWDDFEVTLKDVFGIVKTGAADFTMLTGAITGDTSIQSTEFNIRSLVKALTEWLDILTEISLSIQVVGKEALHMAAGVGAAFGSIKARALGHSKEADDLANVAHSELEKMVKVGVDLFNPGKNGENFKNNPDLTGIYQFEELRKTRSQRANGETSGNNSDIASLIMAASQKYGIDPNFISAVIHRESGYHAGSVSPKGAMGLMQLMKGTADQYGVSNAFDPGQNIEGGTHYLADLIKKYGDPSQVLAAYNAGPGAVDKYHGVPPYAETQKYVKNIMGDYQRYSSMTAGTNGGGVYIENLHIVVPKNMPEESWSRFVRESMTDLKTKDIRNVTAQTAGGAFY